MATYRWTPPAEGGGGDMNDPRNWTPRGVPALGDTLLIPEPVPHAIFLGLPPSVTIYLEDEPLPDVVTGRTS